MSQGQNLVVVGGTGHQSALGGQIMKRLTSAQLFGAPKSARKTKLARAKLLVVTARERAARTAQRYATSVAKAPLRE